MRAWYKSTSCITRAKQNLISNISCNAPLPVKGMADVIIMSATAVAQYQQESKTCHPESTVKRKIYINRDSITLKCTDNIIHRIISKTDTSTSCIYIHGPYIHQKHIVQKDTCIHHLKSIYSES